MVWAVQNFKYGNFDSMAICAANAVLPLFGGPTITRHQGSYHSLLIHSKLPSIKIDTSGVMSLFIV